MPTNVEGMNPYDQMPEEVRKTRPLEHTMLEDSGRKDFTATSEEIKERELSETEVKDAALTAVFNLLNKDLVDELEIGISRTEIMKEQFELSDEEIHQTAEKAALSILRRYKTSSLVAIIKAYDLSDFVRNEEVHQDAEKLVVICLTQGTAEEAIDLLDTFEFTEDFLMSEPVQGAAEKMITNLLALSHKCFLDVTIKADDVESYINRASKIKEAYKVSGSKNIEIDKEAQEISRLCKELNLQDRDRFVQIAEKINQNFA